MDPEVLARGGLDEKTYKQRMKMQPALGKQREKAKDRWKTGRNKGSERRKEVSDEDINMNSSSWEDTESDETIECLLDIKP